jgi:Glycosyltransferase like family 2
VSGAPPVDVVIAVHTPTRPVGRAVASVLEGNARHTRLSVVCHNVAADEIAAVVDPAHRDRVVWLEHRDGTASASGPFNAGMRAAQGDYVSIMGSDDVLRPGAVDAWLALAHAHHAETVVTRLALGSPDRRVPTPPTRPTLRGVADVVRDRLSYRSAPLGLVSTAARARLGAELVEGMPVGGDVAYVTRLWCETRVVVDRRGPGYVIGEDAADRVTYAPRPVEVELAFLRHLLDQPWFAAYPAAVRTAVATKLLRIHVFGAVLHRPDPGWWTPAERSALAGVVRRLHEVAPAAADPLSRADHALTRAVLDPGVPAHEMVDLARARRRHGTPATVVPERLSQVGHREAPPRFMTASWWASR